MPTGNRLIPRRLLRAIESSWSIDTTYCVEDYGNRDPAWGQCAVTSLLLQLRLGGVLRQGAATEPGSLPCRHYWNLIRGSTVDATWRQFAPGTTLCGVAPASRCTLVSDPWMAARAALLRRRVTT